jgi:hypothetical protein
MDTQDVADNGNWSAPRSTPDEEIRDLWTLSSRGPKVDPSTALAPEVLERLVALRQDDRAAFEALRGQPKKTG